MLNFQNLNTLGLDACKKGWCAVGSIDDTLVGDCFDHIKDVILAFTNVDRMLIDIPIGLSSKNFIRTVDSKSRTHLQKRKSSIFSPPCREAVSADNYREALNLNKKITGKGISIQAYNISSKIREIDVWFNSKPKAMEVYEAHPELCFKSLLGKDLQYSKHENEGISIRKEILFNKQQKLEYLFEDLMKRFKRSEVKPDDILDAMALLLINLKREPLKIIYDENAVDETGKNVGIVYG
jgi:predicted RNase H-like nuclease